MKFFIILSCFSAALAAPQAYNYQQPINSNSIGLPSSFLPQVSQQAQFTQASQSSGYSSSLQEGQSILQQTIHTPKVQQTLLGEVNYPTQQQQQPLVQQQNIGFTGFAQQPQQIVQHQQYQPNYQQTFQPNYQQIQQHHPVVTKDIYVHVAPEEREERYQQPQVPLPPPRKHYRILFIKAPTPKIHTNQIRLSQAQNEEKTIIYVLTKKPDPIDLEAAIQTAPTKPPSKPEVYFIKYKTAEEAQHAQRTIQAQYDQLGGTTQVSDEGVAPVTSVVGALETQNTQQQFIQQGNTQIQSSFSNSASSKYLPPIVRI